MLKLNNHARTRQNEYATLLMSFFKDEEEKFKLVVMPDMNTSNERDATTLQPLSHIDSNQQSLEKTEHDHR